MADCSYFRCIQERRFIKRELQKWYKDMVFIVGLERVAEELMGRRKWRHYQDSSVQSHAQDLIVKQSPSIEQETRDKIHETETETITIDARAEDTKENTKQTPSDETLKENTGEDRPKSVERSPTSPNPQPVDWKPQDKCYFCVDGKLLKVNEVGELVPEAGSLPSEADFKNQIIESDDSSSNSDVVQKSPALIIPKHFESLLKKISSDPNMTSLESMAAAQLAAFQRLQSVPELNPFYQNVFLQTLQQQISPTSTPDRTASPSVKTPTVEMSSPSPTLQTGEQPLDLSAKPGGSSMDNRAVFKAKPRISTVPNRRAYTEEELNNALQDILSGKLGTRRAAVLYGIPRSTLRNKVYKLAIEQKRELLANNPPIAVLEGEDDDKDSDQEDEKPIKHEQNHNPWQMDPNTLLQSLLLANASGLGGFAGFQNIFPQSAKEELPEFLRKLLTQPQELKPPNLAMKSEPNGESSPIDRLSMLNLFQQQYNNNKPSQPHLSRNFDTDMDGSDDSSTLNSSILKVPSVKSLFNSGPGVPSSSAQSKNGDATSSSPSRSPHTVASPHPAPSLANHLNMSPSSVLQRQRSESSSPPTAKFNLQDVIRQSISKNFQSNLLDDSKHSTPLMIDPMDQFGNKRPSISVIKNLGGTDISRFGSNPNINQLQPGQLSPNNTGTGGKGTRPKRGKYRNYDRDSLVEAVKAVQRGEMSVHRAGSYYGVPHSTLEYKVKERHLMRPRKREPKPQPLDSSPSSSSIKQEIAGIRPADKSKTIPSPKSSIKSPFAGNGLKMPPFLDPSVAAQLQYTSQLFWQNPGSFPGMPPNFPNNPASFPPNAENFFAQQMLQKFQEDQQQQQFKPPMNGNQAKPALRDPENIFDAVNTNGSAAFLDGIIRQSLDKKHSELGHGTLFEQLLKNTKNSIMKTGLSGEDNGFMPSSSKRPGSPLDFAAQSEIKKERASPPANDNDSDFPQHAREELNGSAKQDDQMESS